MYKIFDLHNDYFLKLKNKKKLAYVFKKNTKNNIVSAIWTSELNSYESMQILSEASKFVNLNEKLLLGVEDLHFINKENISDFLRLRPTYAGLTWNTSNSMAGGAFESGKLTSFGKEIIKQLEDNNIKIDTAHLNEESFLDVCRLSKKPIFCSHTAFYGVNAHPRNLKDYQLKMIVDSGGLVGLCLVSEFLNGTKKSTISDITRHIDYFSCKFGIDNLAIGTDFYGTAHLPKHIRSYRCLAKRLSKELLKLGYTEKSINKIFYENAANFLLS